MGDRGRWREIGGQEEDFKWGTTICGDWVDQRDGDRPINETLKDEMFYRRSAFRGNLVKWVVEENLTLTKIGKIQLIFQCCVVFYCFKIFPRKSIKSKRTTCLVLTDEFIIKQPQQKPHSIKYCCISFTISCNTYLPPLLLILCPDASSSKVSISSRVVSQTDKPTVRY